jgi:asparagine synthase (glutamine-hydrolysing)
MLAALAHRGPDDAGLYVGDGATLGRRRLSIIDLGSGHQPLHDASKTL